MSTMSDADNFMEVDSHLAGVIDSNELFCMHHASCVHILHQEEYVISYVTM